MTLKYSLSVAAPGFTHVCGNDLTHDKHLIIICSSRVFKVINGMNGVFSEVLYLLQVYLLFSFYPLFVSFLLFQNNQVKKYAGYF